MSGLDGTADVDPGWIRQAYSPLHQAPGRPPLVFTLQSRELGERIDPQDFHRIHGLDRRHPGAARVGVSDYVR